MTSPPAGPPRAPASAEDWIARIGIGLLVLGTVFLFKYSIDRGWIGPPIRVAIGYGVGAILLAAGAGTFARRPNFAELLLGGAVAAFFIATYSAHILYALVPVVPSLGILAGVGVLGLGLAVRYARAAPGVIAALGGFAAPLVIEAAPGTESAVLGYLMLLIVVTAGIHALRRWPALLAVAGLGAWVCLGLAIGAVPDGGEALVAVAMTLAWGGYAIVPAAWAGRPVEPTSTAVLSASVVVSPLLWAAQLVWLFDLGDGQTTPVFAAVLVVLVALAFGLRRQREDASAHAVAAAATAALWIVHHFDGDALYVAYAVYAIVAQVIARGFDDRGLRGFANLATLLLAVGFGARVVDGVGTDGFGADAGMDALVLVALWLGGALQLRRDTQSGAAPVLLLAGHVATMAWAVRYVGSASDWGQAGASVVWAVMATSALVAGFVRRSASMRQIGMATLVAVVAKLLVIDLAEVATVLRILLFMGFGAAFLLLSYFLPGLAGAEPDADEPDGTPSDSA